MQPFDLQFFAEEAGAAVETGGVAAATAETPGADGTGEQVAPAGNQEETFDDLIKGKYKTDYDRHVREAINKRFKNQKDNQELIDRMNPAMSLMAQRYGIAPGKDGALDYDALYQKLMDDNSMYEDEAFRRGMNVEDLKRMKQLEIENASLKRSNQEAAREAENRRAYESLVQAGEQLKQVYPDFDLAKEMQNPDFGRLVAVNVPLRTAYEVIHKDDIIAGSMQYAVKQTQQKMSKSIQSGMNRPAENGTSSQSSAEIGSLDPSKLTLKDFARIKAAAERGERVTFQ